MISTNCATKIALHGLDLQTAEYVSRMLGDATVVERASTTHAGVFDTVASKSRSRTEHRRPLLTPDEVMRIGENEAIIRTGNCHPMRLTKSYYDEPPRTASVGALGAAKSLELVPALE
jgi:type IV secretion system protein VirD4